MLRSEIDLNYFSLVLFFGYPDTLHLSPLICYRALAPKHSQNFPKDSENLWPALVHFIGYPTGSWCGASSGCINNLLHFLPGGLSGVKFHHWRGYIQMGSERSQLLLSIRVTQKVQEVSTSSLEQARRLLLFCPNSCFMRLNGSVINALRFLALSLLCLLCHSALRRVMSFFPNDVTELSQWQFLLLSCYLKLSSQTLKLLLQLVDLICPLVCSVVLLVLPSSTPNLSAAQLTIMVVIV